MVGQTITCQSEDNGRTEGDGPVTDYGHRALVLALTCILMSVLNLFISVAVDKFAWLPIILTIGGIEGFCWLVIARGGELWLWDIAPAEGSWASDPWGSDLWRLS